MQEPKRVNANHWIAAVGGVGALAVLGWLVARAAVPALPGVAWLLGVGGLLYFVSAIAAWALVETDHDGFAVVIVPALVSPPVALFAYAGWDPAAAASLVTSLSTLAFLAGVFGLALSFPLGAVTRRCQQWAVVGLLAVAAIPLLVTAASALTPGPPEDRDLLVLVGMVALSVAPLVAIPPYFLGRSTRDRVVASNPSPYPPLVAVAMPYALALGGFLPAPYFARETIYGPWIVVVPGFALLVIVAQGVRLRYASA